ncbi:MAG: clostripain-related cysteine peptidase [Vulcanimicrobiota bacterium]
MRIDAATPARQPLTAVSAYIDAKSAHIETLKLRAVDRFERAEHQADGQLQVLLDGQRHSRTHDGLLFTAIGLLPAALCTAAGYTMAGSVGALAGTGAGLALFALPATFFLHRALKAPQWKAEQRLEINGPSRPSLEPAGTQRLASLVEESRSRAPQARQILFLSGHGNRSQVANMDMEALGQSMGDHPVDITILDACLVGQLEVMSRLAPWAGLVLASAHPIRARGLELENILRPEHLNQPDATQAAVAMAKEAVSTTPSFAVIDTARLQSQLLPALDRLGERLAADPGPVRPVLAQSLSSNGLLSARVDLGSFLTKLSEARPDHQEAQEALRAYRACVPFQKNQHGISFHLRAGRNDPTLPLGWRKFLTQLDRDFKPLW